MSIDSMSTQPAPQASCPFDTCGTASSTGTSVAVRTTVDFSCPRLAAPTAIIDMNPNMGHKVPDPGDDDPELLRTQCLPARLPGQALLYEDEAPAERCGPVAILTEVVAQIVCVPGQRGCRG
jgi:hypothetical protein